MFGSTLERPYSSPQLRLLRTALSILVGAFLLAVSNQPLSAAFQENLWGARPAAMGGAFTAVSDDANAPIYNPAGISLMTEDELTIMYAQLYSGLNLYVGDQTSRLGLGYFSYVPDIKEGRWGSFGFSWTNFVASNLLREDSFSLTYADSYQFETLNAQPVFSYGTNLKLLRRSFSTDSRTDTDPVFNGGREADAFTVDLGVLVIPQFNVLPGLRFGLSAQNVTEPDIGLKSTDRVPARYTLGIAYQEQQKRWLNPSLDISRRDGRTVVAGAWESYLFKDLIALRAGGSEDQLGGGIGYQLKLFRGLVLKLDYAILWPLNVEGTNGSHRVSLTTNF